MHGFLDNTIRAPVDGHRLCLEDKDVRIFPESRHHLLSELQTQQPAEGHVHGYQAAHGGHLHRHRLFDLIHAHEGLVRHDSAQWEDLTGHLISQNRSAVFQIITLFFFSENVQFCGREAVTMFSIG